MPIHLGIACRCKRVHFLASSRRIEVSRTTRSGNIYVLICCLDCAATTLFSKDQLLPYSVAELVFRKGYAELGEYQAEGRAFAAQVT